MTSDIPPIVVSAAICLAITALFFSFLIVGMLISLLLQVWDRGLEAPENIFGRRLHKLFGGAYTIRNNTNGFYDFKNGRWYCSDAPYDRDRRTHYLLAVLSKFNLRKSGEHHQLVYSANTYCSIDLLFEGIGYMVMMWAPTLAIGFLLTALPQIPFVVYEWIGYISVALLALVFGGRFVCDYNKLKKELTSLKGSL